MVIEINKKAIIKAAVALAVIAASVCSGYFWGHSKGYNQGKAESSAWYEAIIAAKENPKGDGSYFYAEEFAESYNAYGVPRNKYMLYHSTTKCKAIEKGVQKNWGYSEHDYRVKHSKFCSKCMDINLITKCEKWLDKDFDSGE